MRRQSRRLGLGVAVLGVALLTTGCWRAGPLDGPGATTGLGTTTHAVSGDKSALAVHVASFTLPAIAEADATAHTLRVGIYGVDLLWRWNLIDGLGATSTGATTHAVGGGSSMVQSSTGAQPIIETFYTDLHNSSLRHATFNGTVATDEDVDGRGVAAATGRTSDPAGIFENPSFMFGTGVHVLYEATHLLPPNSNPSVSFRLRQAWKINGVWNYEDVDGPGSTIAGHTNDNVGTGASVAMLGNNEHAFYHDSTTGRLRHAVYDGSTWTFEDIDGPGVAGVGRVPDDVGSFSTAAVTTSDGFVHVFYLDNVTHRLRHAWSNGGAWSFEDLDGPGVAGGVGRTPDVIAPSITVAANAPAPLIDVFYGDSTTNALRHAQWTGTGWRFEVVDGAGNLTVGGTADQVGVPIAGIPLQQASAAAYGGASSSILHVFTGDLTTGGLREACTLGAGVLAPASCNN